jgi:predicted transcriptional regulator
MLQNNIFLSLKEKNKELGELVKNVGIVEEQLKPFLDKMVAAGVIKLEKNKYSILKK